MRRRSWLIVCGLLGLTVAGLWLAAPWLAVVAVRSACPMALDQPIPLRIDTAVWGQAPAVAVVLEAHPTVVHAALRSLLYPHLPRCAVDDGQHLRGHAIDAPGLRWGLDVTTRATVPNLGGTVTAHDVEAIAAAALRRAGLPGTVTVTTFDCVAAPDRSGGTEVKLVLAGMASVGRGRDAMTVVVDRAVLTARLAVATDGTLTVVPHVTTLTGKSSALGSLAPFAPYAEQLLSQWVQRSLRGVVVPAWCPRQVQIAFTLAKTRDL